MSTPEFDYFGSPHVSKLVDLVLLLGTEVHVASTRVRALEALLVRNGTLAAGAVDTFEPEAREQASFDSARDQLMQRILRIITEAGPAEHPLREQWEATLQRKNG
ncbi:hypothetical protein SAMN05660485_01564 [Blastococcus fimeti]|nr:hypothetical protein SAMN05660485_01564 [Blastococcus fimeti]